MFIECFWGASYTHYFNFCNGVFSEVEAAFQSVGAVGSAAIRIASWSHAKAGALAALRKLRLAAAMCRAASCIWYAAVVVGCSFVRLYSVPPRLVMSCSCAAIACRSANAFNMSVPSVMVAVIVSPLLRVPFRTAPNTHALRLQ